MKEKQLQTFLDKFNSFDKLSALERNDLLLEMSKNFDIENTIPQEKDSICLHMKMPLRTACALKGCPYWADHEWTKNCTLNFLSSQKDKESLSAEQVSVLYRKTPERVLSIYKRCFKVIQRYYLRDLLKNKGAPWFKFMPGFCVSCQTRLLEEDLKNPDLFLGEGLGYCSTECKKKFPPQYFEIEKFFETDFYTVIKLGGDLFNFYYLEEILGFQPNVLRNKLEKLLGRVSEDRPRKRRK